MGLFGWGKKKDNSAKDAAEKMSGKQLRETITRNAAEALVKINMISDPSMMMTVEEDSGLYDIVFGQHITEKRFVVMKNMSTDTYLRVSEMHIMGCGMYVHRMQERLGKSAADFSVEEIKGIVSEWNSTDTYYAGMKAYGYSTDSDLNKDLVSVVTRGYETYMACVGNDWEKPENLNVLMKAMYDVGFTVAEKLCSDRNR